MGELDRDQTSDEIEDEDEDEDEGEGEGGEEEEYEAEPKVPRDPLKVGGTLFAIDAGFHVVVSVIDLYCSVGLDWIGALLTGAEIVVAIGLLRAGSRFRWPALLLVLTFLGSSVHWALVPDPTSVIAWPLIMALLRTLPFALLLLGHPGRRSIHLAIGLFALVMLLDVLASGFRVYLSLFNSAEAYIKLWESADTATELACQ